MNTSTPTPRNQVRPGSSKAKDNSPTRSDDFAERVWDKDLQEGLEELAQEHESSKKPKNSE